MRIQRRQFITLLGGATAWPLAARAQQPALPVIGFINRRIPQSVCASGRCYAPRAWRSRLRRGKGRAIELPALAADLVARKVTVIVSTSVWSRETLEAGALMSYGPDQVAICRRAAAFVDRILKGANPAELPVEEPAKVEFLINLKTAGALGISIPYTLLANADEVIE